MSRSTAHDREMIDRYRAAFVRRARYAVLEHRPQQSRRLSVVRAADMETDRAGRQISYLADENAFQFVRSMQINDRIIPVVGNVAGDKAVKAIGQYATEHGSTSRHSISRTSSNISWVATAGSTSTRRT